MRNNISFFQLLLPNVYYSTIAFHPINLLKFIMKFAYH